MWAGSKANLFSALWEAELDKPSKNLPTTLDQNERIKLTGDFAWNAINERDLSFGKIQSEWSERDSKSIGKRSDPVR